MNNFRLDDSFFLFKLCLESVPNLTKTRNQLGHWLGAHQLVAGIMLATALWVPSILCLIYVSFNNRIPEGKGPTGGHLPVGHRAIGYIGYSILSNNIGTKHMYNTALSIN